MTTSILKTSVLLSTMAPMALGHWFDWYSSQWEHNSQWTDHTEQWGHHPWSQSEESTEVAESSVLASLQTASTTLSMSTTLPVSKISSIVSTTLSASKSSSVIPTTLPASRSSGVVSASITRSASSSVARNVSDVYGPGVAKYTAPNTFPSSAFPAYYPTPVGQEPQPKLFDPVLNTTYPLNLTDPDTIPTFDPDPVFLPRPVAELTAAEQQVIINNVVTEIKELITNPFFTSNCSKCIAALSVAKSAALLAPELVPETMVALCKATKFRSNATCEENYDAQTFGAIWTQVLAFADVSGLDGQYICQNIGSFCPLPPVSPLNTTNLFPKPKPMNATVPKPSGKRVKVLHMSDFHIDPRYKVGSEGNCTSGLCCRSNNFNTALPMGVESYPAPEFGAFRCDTPYDLGLAALQAVGPLTGTSKDNPLAWVIYTGDLVAHDPQSQLSRAFVEYAEDSIFYMFKEYLTGPVFPVLGNHDSNPEAIDAPHSLPGNLSQQQSWNYDHVASLWQLNGWLDPVHAQQARTHYGAYSIKNNYGLRMITFNSDFWYRSNFLNYINTSNPDVSGSFKFVIQELQAAEDAGERVWLFAHVLSGWDGSNPLANPSNLFYQIVERYSPHVIANVFFGHTHEDEVMIYYSNNGTVQNAKTALNTGWIGPSVTPLTNLNSGFRMYEVDTATFDIYDAYTWYADVSTFNHLNTTAGHGPVFQFEYSTRDAYGPAAGWPSTAPLNATFWHNVTEAMERDNSLVSLFNTYEGKSSVMSPNCTNAACAKAKICYIRSGSAALGRACPQGYASVQSPFKPT